MNLDELIKKRDELREQVAVLNLKYVLGYLNAEEFQNLSIQKDSLKDLELEIFKKEKSQKWFLFENLSCLKYKKWRFLVNLHFLLFLFYIVNISETVGNGSFPLPLDQVHVYGVSDDASLIFVTLTPTASW